MQMYNYPYMYCAISFSRFKNLEQFSDGQANYEIAIKEIQFIKEILEKT